MKLINKTNLRSDQLNNFIREVAKKEMVDLKDGIFTIIYRRISSRGTYIGGYAYYGLPARVTIKVPKNVPIDKVELAYVIAHELCHTQGLKHKQMKNAIYNRRYANKHKIDWKQHYLWANDLPLEIETKNSINAVPKNIIIQQKRDKCLKMMNKWNFKIKAASKAYIKWRRKTKYYERQLVNVSVANNLS
jgi:hypothetical protein